MSTTNKSILWTAKDFTISKNLWNFLEGQGFKVQIADGYDDIIARIKKICPRLWVGQTNGELESEFTLLGNIRQKYPDLPIILISTNPSIEDAVRAIKLGATEYIQKNISSEQLSEVIEGALRYPGFLSAPKPVKTKTARSCVLPIAVHHSMKKLLQLAMRIAPSRSTVLIQGESGTGKEIVANYIHENSDRKSGPFIAVNCAALPESLLESELFGHERGAFTNAVSRKKGKFELADNGTLLLDEISEMAISVQAKLLRVLQEREVDRVGGESSFPVDVRVIATTNRDLDNETKMGNFRPDLFFRLNVIPLILPPLRKRSDDIIPLSNFFLNKYSVLNHIKPKTLSRKAESSLKQKSWMGNVRELENLMERATLLVDSEIIDIDGLEFINNISTPEAKTGLTEVEQLQVMPLKKMEKRMIMQALHDHNGNRTHASRILGISVRTLRNKLHEYQKEMEVEEAMT